MRFHIATKHTPENCGFANPDKGIPRVEELPVRAIRHCERPAGNGYLSLRG